MRKVLTLLAVVLVVVLGGLIWLALSSARREPVYQGKPLHYWLAGYDAGNYKVAHPKGPPAPTDGQASEAIRHIGTNAIPTLLHMLQERESPLKSRLIAMGQKQHFFPVEHWAPANQTMKAVRAFQALGPQQVDIAPQLAKIYESEPCVFTRQVVPEILSAVVPNQPETAPLLLRALAETNDALVRANAAVAIGNIHPRADLVVPGLTKALNDTDPRVQGMAADALRAYGAEAKSAVPALTELITTEKAKGTVATATRTFTSGGVTHLMGPNRGFMVLYLRSPGSKAVGFGTSSGEALYFMEEALKAIDSEAAAKVVVESKDAEPLPAPWQTVWPMPATIKK